MPLRPRFSHRDIPGLLLFLIVFLILSHFIQRLPIVFPYVTISIRVPSSQPHKWPFSVILCHSCSIFSPCVPFSELQSNPFTLFSNSLGHPRVLALFFHLSISHFLLCPPSLCCSPAAHKNSSFLSPEDCSVAWGFTAFHYVFSPYLSPCVSAWQHYTVFNSLNLLHCLFNTLISILSFCVFLFSILLE